MIRTTVLAALAAAYALAVPAMGQSFNLDFESQFVGGPGSGAPASSYGAAAAQLGTWQVIGGMTANTPVMLNGLNSAPTAVTISSANTLQGFGAGGNGLPTGNDALLLRDALNLGFPGVQHSFTFNSLANGTYHVLDLVPKGRDEGDGAAASWLRRRDEYQH